MNENSSTYKVFVDGKDLGQIEKKDLDNLDLVQTAKDEYNLIFNHQSIRVEPEQIDLEKKLVSLRINGKKYEVQIKDELDQRIDEMGFDTASGLHSGEINAPMPGLVLKVLVEEGQEVQPDDPIIILEAMKMENVLKAPAAGKVGKLEVEAGDKVEKGKTLVHIN